VVDGTPYLINFGPGVVRRAAAAYRKGVKASTHVVSAFLSGFASRDEGRARGSSARRISRAVLPSQPVPTRPM
jgi:hypothetical protein